MSATVPDRIHDTRSAADYLGLAERTLHNKRCRKAGPRYLKLGRAVRYRQSDLDAWLTANAVDCDMAEQDQD